MRPNRILSSALSRSGAPASGPARTSPGQRPAGPEAGAPASWVGRRCRAAFGPRLSSSSALPESGWSSSVANLPTTLLAFALLTAPGGLSGAPLDTSGFAYKADIRITGYTQAETLTNFPVLVKLGTNITGLAYGQFASSTGGDLRFASDAGDELNYEIDSWNATGSSFVWVQVPALSGSGTMISAYWGRAGLTTPAYATNGATWSNGYVGVWHLNQPNAVNSVSGFVGTAHGNTTATGFIGSAQYFSTNTYNTYLSLGNLRATNLTIEAWTLHANPGDYGGANVDDVVFWKSGSFKWYQWNVDWNLQLDIVGTSTYSFQHSGITDLPLPSWTCEAVSYDSTTGTGRGYMSGVRRYADVKGVMLPTQNNNVCTIGYNSGGAGSYYGSIDEVRLSNVTRSDNWLLACYQNQLSPGTFMSFDLMSKLVATSDATGKLVLNWIGTGQTLQVSPVLGVGASWTTNGLPAPVVSNGVNRVTVSCSAAAAFYRLAILTRDFSLSANPASFTIAQSGSGGGAVLVNGMNGFNGSVTLSVSNLPSGVTAFLSPASTTNTSALSLEVGSSAAAGTYNLLLTGTSSGIKRSTNLGLTITTTATGSAYTWPAYYPNLNYSFTNEYPTFKPPTNILNDCSGVTTTITLSNNWFCFRFGTNKNSLVTSNAWVPMLQRLNTDFAYFRNVMGWPPDKRAKRGYYSAVYLFGSGTCVGGQPTDLGGWMGSIGYNGENWPMGLLSYYPVYSFDPACPYGDKVGQQGAVVHELIHSVLADMPGCKSACWFQEGGNTWLQSTAAALQTGNFNSMGWLSAGSMIAPFMPIENYSGWLQDDSFGGPCAEGVNLSIGGTNYCTWRNLLGGVQYSEAFPHFMGEIVSQGSIAWIWQHCTGRVLEGLATAIGGLGEAQTRRLIKEYRGRQAMCDFGRWTPAYKALLNNNWNASIHAEYSPVWINCSNWTATCYVVTTNNSGTLTPERRTLPGWSGANQIPLKVTGTGTVSVNFQPLGANMSCQLVHRATDNSVVYSVPVASGACSLTLNKPMKTNVVVAVVCNTDYIYAGEFSRTNKFDYRLTFGSGVTNTASINSKWYN
jgi:hypothetical protein